MIGRQIAHYEVIAKVGEGGMGEVYRARDPRLDRTVAIKVLPAEFATDPERLARFRREARLLASLNHTHIAALHGLEEADGQVFLVMELVEGEDLSERLARGPLELDEALEYARQFAEGLEAAHEQSIVHRDLKPANLKLNPDGQLKILDFGLARAYLGDPGENENLEQSPTITAALTGHGVILGTAAYMSPEQARGRKIDQRTDIWAFGAILFEMLTGQRLFHGETLSDTMAAVLRADPPWDLLPAGTPHGVRRLLERCLERDSRRRLRDIGEARVRLERWRENPSTMHESMISNVSAPIEAPRRRMPLPWIVAAVAVLAAAALGLRLFTLGEPAPRLLDLELAFFEGKDLTGTSANTALLSPDGEWMAWVTPAGVWVRELARREPRLLEDTEGSGSMAFSPDSQWLAITGSGELRRVSISGGTPITICAIPTPRGIAWVDETTLVYAPTISSGLMKVDLSDGEVTPLTTIDASRNERSHRWPTVVPGRRAVVFECQFLGRDYDQSDIQIVSLDGGPPKTVHRGGAAPSATGRGHLLFVRGNTLFAVRFDAGSGKTSGLPVPVRENVVSSVGNQEDDDGSAQYSVDRAGNLLYLDNRGAGNQESRLAWLDPRTGSIDPFGPSAKHTALSLSPDGKLAVVSRFRDGDENLYVHDLESGNENMLTYRPSVEYAGAWSPDSRILYWSQSADDGTRFEVWRRPIDGSAPPEFVAASPTPAGIWPTAVSPDGRWLACAAWSGANLRDIMILDLENPDAGFEAFAPSPRDHNEFAWLNDRFVAFREGRGSEGSIMIRHFPDDGGLWSLPDVEGGYYTAVLDASGSRLLIDGPRGYYEVGIEFDGDRLRIARPTIVRTWTLEEQRRVFWVEPAPDGRRLLTLYSEDPEGAGNDPRLVLVTGWLRDIEARIERGR